MYIIEKNSFLYIPTHTVWGEEEQHRKSRYIIGDTSNNFQKRRKLPLVELCLTSYPLQPLLYTNHYFGLKNKRIKLDGTAIDQSCPPYFNSDEWFPFLHVEKSFDKLIHLLILPTIIFLIHRRGLANLPQRRVRDFPSHTTAADEKEGTIQCYDAPPSLPPSIIVLSNLLWYFTFLHRCFQ